MILLHRVFNDYTVKLNTFCYGIAGILLVLVGGMLSSMSSSPLHLALDVQSVWVAGRFASNLASIEKQREYGGVGSLLPSEAFVPAAVDADSENSLGATHVIMETVQLDDFNNGNCRD
jgi:hypothetical protein